MYTKQISEFAQENAQLETEIQQTLLQIRFIDMMGNRHPSDIITPQMLIDSLLLIFSFLLVCLSFPLLTFYLDGELFL